MDICLVFVAGSGLKGTVSHFVCVRYLTFVLLKKLWCITICET